MTTRPGRIHATMSSRVGGLDHLPVRARSANLAGQVSGSSGRPLIVPPGRYVVSATLPDGSEVTADEIVEVGEDGDVPVTLPVTDETFPAGTAAGRTRASPQADDPSPSGAAGGGAAGAVLLPSGTIAGARVGTMLSTTVIGGVLGAALASAVGMAARVLPGSLGEAFAKRRPSTPRTRSGPAVEAPIPGAFPDTAAQRWKGDWLGAWGRAGTDGAPDLRAGLGGHLRLGGGEPVELADTPDADTLLAARETDGRRTLFAVPFDRSANGRPTPPTRAGLALGTDGRTELVVKIAGQPATNAFLAYVRRGLAREAMAISADFVARGESAMADPATSPLGAVLGGYVLLRANELEGLDLWTAQFVDRAPRLPDVLALRVEYLARTGRHAEAIEMLGQVERFGCPWFRSGVSYLLERLRLYLAVHDEPEASFRLEEKQAEHFRDLARTFGRLAVRLDPARLVCTYRDVPVDGTATLATAQQK